MNPLESVQNIGMFLGRQSWFYVIAHSSEGGPRTEEDKIIETHAYYISVEK